MSLKDVDQQAWATAMVVTLIALCCTGAGIHCNRTGEREERERQQTARVCLERGNQPHECERFKRAAVQP